MGRPSVCDDGGAGNRSPAHPPGELVEVVLESLDDEAEGGRAERWGFGTGEAMRSGRLGIAGVRGRSGGAGLALVAVPSGGQVPLDEGDFEVSEDDLYVHGPASAVGVRRGRGGVGVAEHACSLLGGLTGGKMVSREPLEPPGRQGQSGPFEHAP